MTAHISFDEWLDRNSDSFLVAKRTCPNCEGEGYVTCRCCGHDDTCAECDGAGKVESSDGELMLDRDAAQIAYALAKARDAQLLAAWK